MYQTNQELRDFFWGKLTETHGNELHFWVHSAVIFASPSECHFTSCKTDGSIDLPSGLLQYLKYLRGIRAQILKWCKCGRHQPFEKVYININHNLQILKSTPAHRKGEILWTDSSVAVHTFCPINGLYLLWFKTCSLANLWSTSG